MKHYYLRKEDNVVVNEREFFTQCEMCGDRRKETGRRELPCNGDDDYCIYYKEIDTTKHDEEIRLEHDDDRK